MDPNVVLANLVGLMDDERDALSEGENTTDILEDIVENFEGLNEWLSQGGFPPEAWRHAR